MGFLFFIFPAIGCLMLWARSRELKEWNGGICEKTGKPWVHFSTDSQGGRGYNSGKFSCWISYPFVDRVK